MPIRSNIAPIISNRKAGVAINGLVEQIRSPQPAVAQAFTSIGNAINDIYRALSTGQLLQDLIITDPLGNKIIELSGIGQITIWDPSGNQVAMLGEEVEAAQIITGATNASPAVITITAHGYVNGDTIFVRGTTGNTAINGYRIVENATANTFTMTDFSGTAINGNGAYAGPATATRFYGGLLTQTMAIGPSFANYKLRAFADGSLKINNATITLTSANGTIALDPSNPAIEVLDGSGNLLGWVGAQTISSVLYRGGWFKQFYVGGASAAAPVIASDVSGNVSISNATISLDGTNATITLDPTSGDISIIGKGAFPSNIILTSQTDPVTNLASGLMVQNPSAPASQYVSVGYDSIVLVSDLGYGAVASVYINATGMYTTDNLGTTNISLTGSTGSGVFAGTVDAQFGFKKNGVSGTTQTSSLAKLTSGGTNGYITVVGGIVTALNPPT